MKSKLLSILAGGLVLSTPAIATVTQAQTSSSLTQLFPALSGISLTQEQESQLQQLSQQTLPQIENVLNPEQKSQFQTAIAQGKPVRVALLSLNLSIPQKQQLRSIFLTAKTQIDQTLTTEQQGQIIQNILSFKHQR